MTSQQPDSTIELIYPESSERLDKWLTAAIPHLSRSQVKYLIATGYVQAGDYRLKANTQLPPGTPVIVTLPTVSSPHLLAQSIPLDILYEDDYLIAINKPADFVVHPSLGHDQNTLVNALLYRYPDIEAVNPDRPGIVHRLDKDTSGVIVIARTREALLNLQAQFQARSVQKTYLALVWGQPKTTTGLIDVPIGRHPQHRQKMAAIASGKPARTYFKVRQKFSRHTLLELNIETGRTHQIRVHLAWLGYPVVGDVLYGRRETDPVVPRQFLHAAQIALNHPHTSKRLSLTAPLPLDLQSSLESLSEP